MTKAEYRRAVRKSRRRFAYVAIAGSKSMRPIPLSRAKALKLVKLLPDDTEINAEWVSEDELFLLVG